MTALSVFTIQPAGCADADSVGQPSSELQAAFEAATAAAEQATRDNAASQQELAQISLRCAAFEEKAAQLDEELHERNSALQVSTVSELPITECSLLSMSKVL